MPIDVPEWIAAGARHYLYWEQTSSGRRAVDMLTSRAVAVAWAGAEQTHNNQKNEIVCELFIRKGTIQCKCRDWRAETTDALARLRQQRRAQVRVACLRLRAARLPHLPAVVPAVSPPIVGRLRAPAAAAPRAALLALRPTPPWAIGRLARRLLDVGTRPLTLLSRSRRQSRVGRPVASSAPRRVRIVPSAPPPQAALYVPRPLPTRIPITQVPVVMSLVMRHMPPAVLSASRVTTSSVAAAQRRVSPGSTGPRG